MKKKKKKKPKQNKTKKKNETKFGPILYCYSDETVINVCEGGPGLKESSFVCLRSPTKLKSKKPR